ncbi:UNVERIFIED_CONTAM: hypothetical protein GTU68_061069 [Idotea baltica]|nr:hypothetical protein [Idotea baltica]
MKTAIIERYPTLGGTCLNVGCIPSKALLDSSHHYHDALHKFAAHGISVGTPKVDMDQMINRKAEVVKATTDGVEFLMKKNKIEFKADYCLVSTGRRPYTDNLGLENAGVLKDDRGRIATDGHLQTNIEGIYAIGDVVKGAMLAHKASEEGVFVAEVMAGQHPHINYRAIPGVVYTWPEVAGVGFTEEELKAEGKKYKSGSFHFRASGRARASMDTDGLVKILSDQETDEILGMHIIGPRAADMIMEGVMGLEFRASAEDLAIFSHPHPTFSESIKEAAMDATGSRAIHK